jgi:hypothetical protein
MGQLMLKILSMLLKKQGNCIDCILKRITLANLPNAKAHLDAGLNANR